MTETPLIISSLTLKRYPEHANNPTLQAWDSADELLLNYIEEQAIKSFSPIAIFNDNFGTLTCALNDSCLYVASDSKVSQLGTEQNLKLNQLSKKNIHFLNSLEALPETPKLVVIKIPKMLSLLEYQLKQLSQVITADTIIIGGAKSQDIHSSTLQLFEKILGKTKTSLAVKKSRLIFCQPDEQLLKNVAANELVSWTLEGTNFEIYNDANVFSRSGLDIGARFFLANLPECITGTIVDLGCGNGVIGLKVLEQNPQAKVMFIDESYMAVASSKKNIEHNLAQDMHRCEFQVSDCMTQIANASVHAVLCNPPFHQNNTITDHIAYQMFIDAHRCLAYGGELRVIGNRHLMYHQKLKRLFGNCHTIASNSKFVILRAVKLS